MTHETDNNSHHDLFDGFVPETPSTNEFLEQTNPASKTFETEIQVYKANKALIDNAFTGQFIVMDSTGKIRANSKNIVLLHQYVKDYLNVSPTTPVWIPEIPRDEAPRHIGGALLGRAQR